MATASSLLSEEQLLCSICLNVYNQPVSIQCGHNFCKACITEYWVSSGQLHCPLCRKYFEKKPDLFVNTLISEMAVQIRKSAQEQAASSKSPNREAANPGDVPCDICPGKKLKALKTCLVCLASYCETHLEPHQRVAALKRHKLIDPVENLEDRLCKNHSKVLELFCRTDQMCICILCSQTNHKSHDAVSLEEEYEESKSQLGMTKTKVQQMIQERLQKVQEIKHSAELNRKETKKEVADSVEVFTALVSYIQRKQVEFIEVIEEKQRAVEKQADGFIKELEQEITELQRRSTELEQLSHTEDHLHLLQSFPSLSTPPPTKDWSEIRVRSYLSVGTVRGAGARLQEKLSEEMETLQRQVEKELINEDGEVEEKLPELEEDIGQTSPEAVTLNGIKELYAVDVTLDPDTAHPMLIVSDDRRQVKTGYIIRHLYDYSKRFDTCFCVLGKQGFSGRFYYEVQVKGKTNWIVGVARESINRRGIITYMPDHGFWAIGLNNRDQYTAPDDSQLQLYMTQKVGVFVDYEAGEVSFYDVEASALIYSFIGCTFTDRLYPFLSPGSYEAENSTPMIITPGKNTWPVWTLVSRYVLKGLAMAIRLCEQHPFYSVLCISTLCVIFA